MDLNFTPAPRASSPAALALAFVVAFATLIGAGFAGLGGGLSTLLAVAVGGYTWATFAPPVRK